jgi:threonine dehydratase
VQAAAVRLQGIAHRTPVFTSRLIDEQFGARLFFKCENLQRAGAFKFRGAFNALSLLDGAQRRRGVIAFSSGNHAQAVALAAQMLGAPATIVMPQDAPAGKLAATRDYGARIVLYDRYSEDRVAITAGLARERGLAVIPPFDHADVIAGQGTAALELLEQAGTLDALFTPLGGGGLLAGSLLAAHALQPACRVYGVEPEAGDDVRQSLRSGQRVAIPVPQTIADGAQTTQVGALTFPIIQSRVTNIVTASDDSLREAMRLFATRLKLVVEPTGCLGYAGAGGMRSQLQGLRVGVILSGGNRDY